MIDVSIRDQKATKKYLDKLNQGFPILLTIPNQQLKENGQVVGPLFIKV